MNTTDFNKLLTQLPTLETAQQTMLAQRMMVLSAYAGGVPKSGILHELYTAITHVLRAQGQTAPSYPQFTKLTIHATYVKNVASIQPFFTQIEEQGHYTQVQRVQAYVTFLTILIDTLSIAPLTVKTLISCLHLIPTVVETQFPGYYEAGMLSWVIQLPITH